jgi:hypothetical protein
MKRNSTIYTTAAQENAQIRQWIKNHEKITPPNGMTFIMSFKQVGQLVHTN